MPQKPESPEETAPKKSINPLVVQMILGVTVPPILTGLYVGVTNTPLPEWLQATLFVLILCVEIMIFAFTAKLVLLMKAAQNLYEDIVKLANDVKAPLERIGKMFLGLKDLLPLIEQLLSKVDKEQAKKFLEEKIREIDAGSKKMDRDQVAAAAERLTGGKPGGP